MAYQILVVDNQRETSKAIQAGIESLGLEFVVATAMSGEEALLEARLRKFDVLISEMRLSGMSGAELVGKLRASKQHTKVILTSRTLDRYVRREAADVGIETILQKPLVMADLLRELQSALGLVEKPFSPSQQEEVQETEPVGISDRLASLRQELAATLALLMSDTGEILMQAGDFLSWGLEAEIASLTAVFSAGNKIARLLGATVTNNFYAFKGNRLDLVMTQVGDSHALLVGLPSHGSTLAQMDKIYQVIQQGTNDLQTILADMGIALVTSAEGGLDEPLTASSKDLEDQEKTFEVDSALDALFSTAEQVTRLSEADTFWEINAVEDTGIFASADALSYEQARQLGLAPNEEE
jgi:CheY-like chemotaxis protein